MDTRPKTKMVGWDQKAPTLTNSSLWSQEVELDGLEGNEDFWNMDLSDDEVPRRDTTPKHASESVHLCWIACPLPALYLKQI